MPRILVVDDLRELRLLTTQFLNNLGITTTDFPNAVEALAHLAEDSDYDAVFTDYQMPIMNGIEFIEQVSGLFPHIPIVLIASFVEPQMHKEALAKGAALVMDKPYTQQHYVNALKAIHLL